MQPMHCFRCARFDSFLSLSLQQAFNATAVVRHMRRLQLGTSHEGPNPTLPSPCRSHLLMPEEDAGTEMTCSLHTHVKAVQSPEF